MYQADPQSAEPVACVPVNGTETWQDVAYPIPFADGVHPLYLRFRGSGRVDLKTIALGELA